MLFQTLGIPGEFVEDLTFALLVALAGMPGSFNAVSAHLPWPTSVFAWANCAFECFVWKQMRNTHRPALSFTQIPSYVAIARRADTLAHGLADIYHVIFHYAHLEFHRSRVRFFRHVSHPGGQNITGNRFWFASFFTYS